ncbi:MAG: hypothetical protein ACE5Q6_06000 [Dehalococcoidia bacterium]
MSDLEIFGWGMAGAVASFCSIVVLPELQRLYSGEITIDRQRIIVAVIRAAIFMSIGGIVAVVLSDASQPRRAAFFYGAGWEGLLKGGGAGLNMLGRKLQG